MTKDHATMMICPSPSTAGDKKIGQRIMESNLRKQDFCKKSFGRLAVSDKLIDLRGEAQ